MDTISNKVRYYHSAMPNAPVLSGTAGALIGVLDACLVNGFDSKSINSLTVTDGIAVAQISAGHSYGEGDVLRLAGATPTKLNSDWRLASVTANTVTFSVEGVGIPDGAATGTITALRAPAGWEKVFADGTTRAAYRSLDHAAHNGLILYVDDTGTTTARVRGFESMTDIDTGTGPFPTDAQLSGGLWWAKSNTADTVARPWRVAADGKRVTVCPEYYSAYPGQAPAYAFGRLLGAEDDLWGTVISGSDSSANAMNAGVGGTAPRGLLAQPAGTTALTPAYLPRPLGGVGTAQQCAAINWSPSATGISSYPARTAADPLYGAPPRIAQGGYEHRGVLCGQMQSWQWLDRNSVPAATTIGACGNGVVVMYSSAASWFSWLLDLGRDGAWD